MITLCQSRRSPKARGRRTEGWLTWRLNHARRFDSLPARFTVAMLAFPGLTLLDLVGPQAAWGFHADTYIVWNTLDPILADTGVSILPTHTFETCPRGVDILFVPGGFGTWEAMGDAGALQFLRDQAKEARYVTSVCTGSLVLAAAGLVGSRRAATHWAAFDFLAELGAQGVHARVVTDGNLITGGGVTAGIDFGLTVLAELLGDAVAKETQLMLEYDPEPPFDAGSPVRAGTDVTGRVTARLGDDMTKRAAPAVAAAKRRLDEQLLRGQALAQRADGIGRAKHNPQ